MTDEWWSAIYQKAGEDLMKARAQRLIRDAHAMMEAINEQSFKRIKREHDAGAGSGTAE